MRFKLNPYTFLYCSLYKFFENKSKAKDRISFGLQSLLGIGFMIYFAIIVIIIKTKYDLSFHLGMNKYLFGLLFTIVYYSLSYLLFDKNDRYIKFLDSYRDLQSREIIFHFVFWVIVLLIPFGLNIL